MELKTVKEIKIPHLYRRLEYIESTGTQYINTGVNATNNLKISMSFKQIYGMGNMGCIRQSGTSHIRHHISTGNNKMNYSLGGAYSNVVDLNNLIGTGKHTWSVDNATGVSQLDGVNTSFTPVSAFDCQGNYYLFARNQVNMSTNITYSCLRLYWFQCYSGTSTVIRNFIPCQRKSDNTIGMYDSINNVFYPNAGTGEFIAGPVTDENFDGAVKMIQDSNGNIIWGSQSAFPYRRLEYIHFNGAERIETPFYAGTSGVNYQSEFTIDEVPTGSNTLLYIGINDQTINNNLARLYLPQVNSTGIHINIGNT